MVVGGQLERIPAFRDDITRAAVLEYGHVAVRDFYTTGIGQGSPVGIDAVYGGAGGEDALFIDLIGEIRRMDEHDVFPGGGAFQDMRALADPIGTQFTARLHAENLPGPGPVRE